MLSENDLDILNDPQGHSADIRRQAVREIKEGRHISNQLGSAVELIRAIAHGYTGAGVRDSVDQVADKWLEQNGFECKATAQRQRDRRADELDKEIARLQKEREQL
jgi:hypothetical protein